MKLTTNVSLWDNVAVVKFSMAYSGSTTHVRERCGAGIEGGGVVDRGAAPQAMHCEVAVTPTHNNFISPL